MTVDEAIAELDGLANEKVLAANLKRGDDHGLNLSALRKLANSIKTNHSLAIDLWATGRTDARLLALLLCTPQTFDAAELESMLRDTRPPKVNDWFVNYVLKKTPLSESLRERWMADADDSVSAAGWSLTAVRVAKSPGGLDLEGLLTTIETEMAEATPRRQWSMNEVLAYIGIHHPALRQRALDIGERLQVLADYPTSPGCTSPFAPLWIAEMVRRES